ncbi:hypothetical protein E2H98_04345 [Permianibacter aggregans]|uniref:hypothetical protein n=1 Tax=Permianibacter aggregans TaxID=1510150 RepID=UPI0012FAD012|nr:hypothetical protein [Permianibacter aggregans]QGX38937.1 hypothetical protein E2H98_04345 [Permianibacter aggregans]
MIRILVGIIGGLAAAFALFVFMAFLVSVGEVKLNTAERVDIDFSMSNRTTKRRPKSASRPRSQNHLRHLLRPPLSGSNPMKSP